MFSNLTQFVGIPLNGVVINLGSSAVVEWDSFSSSSRLCVTSNSASIFSCHIHRLCTLLVTNTTQLNGAPLLAFVLVLLLIVFFPFSCIFPLVCCLRTLQAFLSPQENYGIRGLHVLLPLSHRLSRYIMIYFHFLFV